MFKGKRILDTALMVALQGQVLPKTLKRLGRRYGKKQEPTGKQLAKRMKRARDYNRCCSHYYFHESYHLVSAQ